MPLPQRTRPLSILGSLKFRPNNKQGGSKSAKSATANVPTASAAPSGPGQSQAVTIAISGPLNLAAEGMVPGRVGTSTAVNANKMQAYAKAPEPVTNGSSTQRNVDRADTPHYSASRQVMADAARLNMANMPPLPNKPGGANRFGNARGNSTGIPQPPAPPSKSPPQPPHASPPMRRARAISNDRIGNGGSLWPASVIADSEFNSPRSNNGVDGRGRYQPLKDVGVPQNEPWNTRQSQYGDIFIGADGTVKVRSLSQDHSSERHQVQDHYSGSPPERAKLPILSASQRRSYAERPLGNGLADEDEIMGAVPSAFESNNRGLQAHQPEHQPQEVRPMTQFDNIDDYEIRSEGAGASNVTPKASKKVPPKKVLMESSMPPFPGARLDRMKKKRRWSCDYDDNQLSTMKYSALRSQAFDEDPGADSRPPGAATSLEGEALAAKIEYYKTRNEAEQAAFFCSMSVGDWERSGDWFMDQFSSLVQQMKESRQNRRKVVAQFEVEISKREEMVRLKNESIAKKLDRMRQDGQRVLVNDDED
jgi:hypothetical protein